MLGKHGKNQRGIDSKQISLKTKHTPDSWSLFRAQKVFCKRKCWTGGSGNSEKGWSKKTMAFVVTGEIQFSLKVFIWREKNPLKMTSRTFASDLIQLPIVGPTWRIIPASKWLITMVIVSPLNGAIHLPNGHSWLIHGGDSKHLLNGMILQAFTEAGFFSHSHPLTTKRHGVNTRKEHRFDTFHLCKHRWVPPLQVFGRQQRSSYYQPKQCTIIQGKSVQIVKIIIRLAFDSP